MGSKIHLDSKAGEGTTFYFDIVTETEEGERITKGSIDKIKRCLIIDDNANNRLILEEMLSVWDISCESCDNGLMAVRLLETSKPFDVIICDYNMPDIEGLETIRMIREKLKPVSEKQPIILLHSSSDDAELYKKCEELGVRFRLTKPVKSNDLYSYLLQVNEPEKNGTDPVVSAVPETQVSGLQSNRIKILIAEDVAMNMVMIKAMLKAILYNVELSEAANGIEVLEQIKKTQPDLIFMDVQMPEMDGLEATREIRRIEQISGIHIPIVALTAGALKEDKEKGLLAGMDDFLTKPVESKKIKAVLEKYLVW
jgi:CheY-like chemotaxis protein